MNLKSIEVKKDKKTNSVTILTSFDMPEVQGQMDITYVVFANTGAVKVTEDFKATEGAKVSDMFRFGMLMQMPYTMEKSNYYGRGPIENYSDRKDCMRIGVYTDDADNQYFPYIRPQESGTKSDIRWVEADRCYRSGLAGEELHSILCQRYPLRYRGARRWRRQGAASQLRPEEV